MIFRGLSREQEIAFAKQIDATRTRFRRRMLASDFMLRGAVALLEKVRDRQLRLDRTIEVSVAVTAEKTDILRRLKPNLVTLVHLLEQNRRDYLVAINRREPVAVRRRAWRWLERRRNKAVRLVEELQLRGKRLQPLWTELVTSRSAWRYSADRLPNHRPAKRRPIGCPHCGKNCTT